MAALEEDRPVQYFLVNTKLRVREDANLQAKPVQKDGQDLWLYEGDIIEADAASRTEADDYVWLKHQCGWSAVRPLSNEEIYLEPAQIDANAILLDLDCRRLILPFLFQRLPVDPGDVAWLQYFGNTTYAEEQARGVHGTKYVRSYRYSQGFHAGIDFGNKTNSSLVIKAGINGKIHKIYPNSKVFKPNYIEIKTAEFTIIYGHLSIIDPSLVDGADVQPDTTLATITYKSNAHLHLEVRRAGGYILNPLLVMPPAMRDKVMGIDDPRFFVIEEDPTRWQEPLDQPVINRGGDWRAPWPEPAP